MGKANISFPDGLLEEVDRRAAAAGITRSGFVQEATTSYITALEVTVEHDARHDRILAAMRAAATVGERMDPGPDGDTIIRDLRDLSPSWESLEGEDRAR